MGDYFLSLIDNCLFNCLGRVELGRGHVDLVGEVSYFVGLNQQVVDHQWDVGQEIIAVPFVVISFKLSLGPFKHLFFASVSVAEYGSQGCI